MHPILFYVGKFPVHSFGVMMIVAFFACLWFLRKRAPKFGIDPEKITDAAIPTLLLGILGARITFILLDLDYYLHHRSEMFSIEFQGLTSFGGVLFGLIFMVFWARKAKYSLMSVLDLGIAPLLLGQAIGRVGCLLNGCCYGGVCPPGTPWGIHVDQLADLHHPAQIYESLMDLGGLFILLQMEKRGLNRGQSFGAGLALYGIARFIYEFWRIGSTSTKLAFLPISDAQLVAFAMILAGTVTCLIFRSKAPAQVEMPV
jgi:phosphatidylglycerol:prolipoprotein diacylglycerol transferase